MMMAMMISDGFGSRSLILFQLEVCYYSICGIGVNNKNRTGKCEIPEAGSAGVNKDLKGWEGNAYGNT